MGYQDVAFLSSVASFCTTFLENCGKGESLMTTTCPKAGWGVSIRITTCLKTGWGSASGPPHVLKLVGGQHQDHHMS